MNPEDMNLSKIEFLNEDWTDLYPDAEEYIPENAPEPRTKPIQITAMVDASHASCMETRRSVTGYMVFLGHALIKWYSKRQSTVESSTYGSELVAMRIATEAVLDLRYKLRMMGIAYERSSVILCDNQACVYNTKLPSSSLKKKHNAVAYHKCREAVAAGIVKCGFIRSEENIADILTKPKGPADVYRLTREVLYGRHEDEGYTK